MTSSSVSQDQNPILTFEGKRYDLNKLPDDLKELVRGMQVADAQLRMHEDTLKVLAVGRQSMAMQLNERLKEVTPLENAARSFNCLSLSLHTKTASWSCREAVLLERKLVLVPDKLPRNQQSE